MDTTNWHIALNAFEAGAKWALHNVRVINDGDGHFDRMDPELDDIKRTAEEYANHMVRS